MTENIQAGGQTVSEGDIATQKLASSEYEQRVNDILAHLSLSGDVQAWLTVRVENGATVATARAATSDGRVTADIGIVLPDDVREGLSAALATAEAALRDKLKLAVARTIVAELTGGA